MTKKGIPGAVITILVVVAVDVLSFMVIMPIIDTFCQALGASKSLIGMQFTVYSIAAIVSSFVVGRISDRYGRKTIFFFSAIGTVIAAVGCILLTNFTQFLIFTALSGLCTGTVGTAYAYIGDMVSDDKERSRYIAYVTATLSLCFVIGPLLGGVISSVWSIRGPFYFSACIGLLEIVLVLKYLKSPKELEAEKQYKALLLVNNESSSEEVKKEQQFYAAASVESPIRVGEGDEAAKTMSRASSFSEIMARGAGPTAMVNPSLDLTASFAAKFTGSGEDETNDDAQSENDIFQALDDEKFIKTLFPPPKNIDEELANQRTPLINDGPLLPVTNDHNTNNNATEDDKNTPSHPWFDYRALLIGGMGTALNTLTYLGIIALIPLILEESKYGIVSDSNDGDDDGVSDHDIKTISRYMGFYLGCYGFTQVLGMVVVFPRLSQRVGIMYCGVIGSIIFGLAFFTIFTTSSPTDIFAVCIPMAFGNSLCRPVFPSYLGSIATKQRRAEYMAISATFGNVALMIGGQMTYLYTTFSPELTIFLCGGASILNGILILLFTLSHPDALNVNPAAKK